MSELSNLQAELTAHKLNMKDLLEAVKILSRLVLKCRWVEYSESRKTCTKCEFVGICIRLSKIDVE